jgi:hypothetical protein
MADASDKTQFPDAENGGDVPLENDPSNIPGDKAPENGDVPPTSGAKKMPAWGKGSKVIKRGRGRPKGSRNKAGGRTPHVPPAVESPDPFAEAVADPPQAAEAQPVAPTQRLGEAQAEILLNILFSVWNGYASGVPAWLMVKNKKPELFDAAHTIWKLSADEQATLKPPLVAKMAQWELDPDDVLLLTVISIFGIKIVATIALTGGALPPGIGELLGVPTQPQPPTVDTTATPQA